MTHLHRSDNHWNIEGFKGIVRNDLEARAAYSEAADISQIIPLGVAVPEDTDDVISLIGWAEREKFSLTPRGSGSSMAGGAIGPGVIIDLSRINHISPVNPVTRTIRVGPGAIRDMVDSTARRSNLRFPPDPSSGRFCTVGGMVSTNAAGSHSLKFGATRNWVQSIVCVLADGTAVKLTRGSPQPQHPILDRITALHHGFADAHANGRLTRRGVFKESSGYGIDKYLESGDLIDLLIGSEGTLGIITEIELRLIPVAEATSSVLGAFTSLDAAVIAAVQARNFGAVACELLDKTYLDIAGTTNDLSNLPFNTEAVLLAEVEAEDISTSGDLARQLAESFREAGAPYTTMALSPSEEHEMWELRHAASPTLNKLGPTHTSMQFIEDCGVPPENFPEFILGIREILQLHNVPGVIFGHAGDCHAHVNPLINVEEGGWRDKVESILGMTVALTGQLGGTLAAEHGDGRLRAPLLNRIWPPEAIAAFKQVKEAFDPDYLFNPGVKVPLDDQRPLNYIKYDPLLEPLPENVREMLNDIARNRSYDQFRLERLAPLEPPPNLAL